METTQPQTLFQAKLMATNGLMTKIRKSWTGYSALLFSWLCVGLLLHAQPAARFVGTITLIEKATVTVKTDAGEQRVFDVSAEAVLKRIAPGEKDLSKAETIQFGDLAVGDRVLVKLDSTADASTPQASQVIAVKQADLAQKQQKDREDWQKRGVGGLVKSVDASGGAIVLSSGAGPTAKMVTVKTTPSTVLKRYAQGSVRFDEAQPAPIDAIHAGDQLRARGDKSADGSQVTAEEVVSGSFRNIAGTISSIDTAGKSMVIKDLATKKQITVKISPEAQMRRLPERMAQMLATRLKGAPGGAPTPAGGPPAGTPPPGGPPAAGQAPPQHSWNGSGQGPGGMGQGSAGGMGQSTDPQQMLNRAPSIQLSDLQKGEAVMLVSTEGTNDVSVITLLAGVEPLLESPAASQNLLSNWSMGGGGGGEAGGGGPQ